jgi:hypothetical protein
VKVYPIWSVGPDDVAHHHDGNATKWFFEYFELSWILVDRFVPEVLR